MITGNKKLTPEQYEVLRNKGTEPPYTGAYLYTDEDGTYCCAACDSALFTSEAKFDSASGWPSFSEPAHRNNIELKHDTSKGTTRTEVLCSACGGHLGHVFEDGPPERGGKRYCINSTSLTLHPTKGVKDS